MLVNSIAYFRMYFIGSIAVVMYNVGASILQSVGDSKSPMRYLIAASLINIVLDLILGRLAAHGRGRGGVRNDCLPDGQRRSGICQANALPRGVGRALERGKI